MDRFHNTAKTCHIYKEHQHKHQQFVPSSVWEHQSSCTFTSVHSSCGDLQEADHTPFLICVWISQEECGTGGQRYPMRRAYTAKLSGYPHRSHTQGQNACVPVGTCIHGGLSSPEFHCSPVVLLVAHHLGKQEKICPQLLGLCLQNIHSLRPGSTATPLVHSLLTIVSHRSGYVMSPAPCKTNTSPMDLLNWFSSAVHLGNLASLIETKSLLT